MIHLDTGWFTTDWRCDYKFDPTRFPDPAKMITDLKDQGFHISLWQLPYFVPKNPLFPEIVEKNLAVKDAKGNLPTEDAILDFSNPDAVKWYQDHLAELLKMGVGAIKTDFGEAAPASDLYASGRTGFYEHNLYPLRYQQAVAEVTKQTTGENIIWARTGGPAVSAIPCIGAATPTTPTPPWVRRFARGCHSASAASPSGATTLAVSRAVLLLSFTGDGCRSAC